MRLIKKVPPIVLTGYPNVDALIRRRSFKTVDFYLVETFGDSNDPDIIVNLFQTRPYQTNRLDDIIYFCDYQGTENCRFVFERMKAGDDWEFQMSFEDNHRISESSSLEIVSPETYISRVFVAGNIDNSKLTIKLYTIC
jgi:hypothetical protein